MPNSVYYTSGYKHQLAYSHIHMLMLFQDIRNVDTHYLSITDGVLTIAKGYAWDGCSGPTIDTKTNQRAGLVHDALYQLMRLGYIPESRRKDADREFREICKQDGMFWLRRALYYDALRGFGGRAAKLGTDRKIQVAP